MLFLVLSFLVSKNLFDFTRHTVSYKLVMIFCYEQLEHAGWWTAVLVSVFSVHITCAEEGTPELAATLTFLCFSKPT